MAPGRLSFWSGEAALPGNHFAIIDQKDFSVAAAARPTMTMTPACWFDDNERRKKRQDFLTAEKRFIFYLASLLLYRQHLFSWTTR
jgi:hypothetical protein